MRFRRRDVVDEIVLSATDGDGVVEEEGSIDELTWVSRKGNQ